MSDWRSAPGSTVTISGRQVSDCHLKDSTFEYFPAAPSAYSRAPSQLANPNKLSDCRR